jgi:hypothetical protein
MPFKLQDFTIEKLYQLRNEVDTLISKHKDNEQKQAIRDEVQEQGFSCQVHYSDQISGLESFQVPLFIRVWTCDKEDLGDIHVSDYLADVQRDWVKRLDFDYSPSDSDDYEIPNGNKSDWDFGDWDDPIRNIGVMEVNIYYKPQPCPAKGTKWESIDTVDGWVDRWENRDGILVRNDEITVVSRDKKFFILLKLRT